MIFKLLGQEIDIGTTANNVNSSNLVRVVNTGGSNTVLLQKYSNGTTYASASLVGGTEVVIEKQSSDLLIGNNMKATPVAYRY
jgi:hypothetical protein